MENNTNLNLLEKKADLLLRTGQLLMTSGADSNRIDRNLKRVASHMGLTSDHFQMHITYTTLMLSISDGVNSITKFKKCSGHTVNMTLVSSISKLSWKAVRQNYSLDTYEQELDIVSKTKHHYPRWIVLLCVGLACGGFCKLFGADWPAMLIASLAASVGLYVRQELVKLHVNHYMAAAAAACATTLITCPICLYTNWTSTPQDAIAAAVLFLIPGVPLINSLDDMIDGFTIVGITRAVVAFMFVLSIAFGMMVAMNIFGTTNHPLTHPATNKLIIALSGAIAATGFALLFNVPKNTLLLCALGGAIAVLTRNILRDDVGFGLPLASFCGALLSSTIAIYWVHKVHTPGHVITIPPVIPMVPGVLAYSALMGGFTFIGSHDPAIKLAAMITMNNGVIEFILVILGLALGVAIPNIIDRHYISKLKVKM